VKLLAELLRPFGEGVWAAVDSLRLLLGGAMDPKEWTRKALDRGRAAYLAGRIQRIESLSKATLENALQMLRDRGALTPAEGKGAKLALTDDWKSEQKLSSLADEVDLFLR